MDANWFCSPETVADNVLNCSGDILLAVPVCVVCDGTEVFVGMTPTACPLTRKFPSAVRYMDGFAQETVTYTRIVPLLPWVPSKFSNAFPITVPSFVAFMATPATEEEVR